MAAKRQPNEKDYITNKVLAVFSICLLGVLGLMLLYRVMNIGSTWLLGVRIAQIACALGAVGTIIGIVKFSKERKSGQDTRYQLTRGTNLIVVFAALTVVMFIVMNAGLETIRLFYIILPALAVFYLIFHSYPREFFVVAVDCGAAAALLWFARIALTSSNYTSFAWGAAAVAVVLAIVQMVLVQKVRKTGCVGLVDGKRINLFTATHAYLMMHVTAVVMALAVLAGVAIGAQAAYYLVFAAFAYLFVSAVYYTVKML